MEEKRLQQKCISLFTTKDKKEEKPMYKWKRHVNSLMEDGDCESRILWKPAKE
jgi:hypothetical protein